MSVESFMTIYVVNKKKVHSQEEIKNLYKEELRGYLGADDLDKRIEREGIVPVISLCETPTEEEKEYHQLGKQIVEVFPVSIDTKSGCELLEIYNTNFLSDFDELLNHYNIRGGGASDGVEISYEDAKKMLQVLNYILAGNYNEQIEDVVFENNEFFEVFENQFFSFKDRFRKKNHPQQTIRIVIDDKRSKVVQNYDDDEYSYDDSENREIRRIDQSYAKSLYDVLTMFVNLAQHNVWSSDKNEFKLFYTISY